MEKTRIAFFADVLTENFDGAVRTMYQIFNKLDKNRFELLIFCGEPPKEDFGFRIVNIPNIEIPFNKSYRMALPFLVKGRILQELDDFDPHLIHIATPSALGHFALSYGKENQISVSTIYHTHFESYVKYYLRNFKEIIPLMRKAIIKSMKRFYNDCDLIFIPTIQMKQELSEFEIRTDKMVLWPRGVDRKMFNPAKKSSDFIHSKTNYNKYNLLFASRLVWEKNLETLIEIYRMAEFANLPYNFIIVGDGVAREELERKMPNAIFTGSVDHDELSKYYASSDVFVFPSISETYGSVVIEAMSSGLPCVIANGGGSAGFITNGHNGFLCAPNNHDDYLIKICRVLSDKKIHRKFKLNGLSFVKDLNWDHLIENLFLEWETLATKSEYLEAS